MAIGFDDRRHAGRLLAGRLEDLRDQDIVVLALPRGGVPVAVEIARRLGADLDVLVVRKLGVPGHEELALGAVGADGNLVVNEDIAAMAGADARILRAVADALRPVLTRRAEELRDGRPPQPVEGRVTVVVDDGIATGASMRAALDLVRSSHPAQIVAAVPVAPPDTCAEMAVQADRVECLSQPEPFSSVGRWYREFTQISDDEVRSLLDAYSPAHR